jgi:phospholipase C
MVRSPNRIQHVIVLMLENRSFDHIFGYRAGVDGLSGTNANLLDPTKPASASNPSFPVTNAAPFAISAGEGPGHSINATNIQLFNSKLGPAARQAPGNLGFVSSYNTEFIFADKIQHPTEAQLAVVMASFPSQRLPVINALADAFCLCDHWFSEVPGPTQPNRLFMHAATSFGYAHNVWTQQFPGNTIYANLAAHGLSWATYDFDTNEVRNFTAINGQTANFKDFSADFAKDVATGTLPSYSFIVPRMLNQNGQVANDQHAPADVRFGDNFIADVYEALRANPAVWNSSALIVTYDEHGGFYDHVPPPSAPNPDGLVSPSAGDTASFAPSFAFDRLGLRVPALIISPWVAKGSVISTQLQHTSILATVKELFGLPAFLTKRDASAASFASLLTSGLSKPRTDTPTTLPRSTIPSAAGTPYAPGSPDAQPLDRTQVALVQRAHVLTQSSHPDGPPLDELPETQGEAATSSSSAMPGTSGGPARPRRAARVKAPAHGRTHR